MTNNSKLIFIFLLFSSLNCLKKREKCIQEAFSGSLPQDLQLASHKLYTKLLLNFNLLPTDIKEKLRECNIDIKEEIRFCEHKYGYNNCEECGMVIVPKCPLDFISVDCSICARKCPQHTEEYSGGLLCAKPELRIKQIYSDKEGCELEHGECEQTGKFWLGGCDVGFEPVGNFMCSFKCPEGFEDENDFCRPEVIENFDFTFEDLA